MAVIVKLFIGGGGDDWFTGIVKGYAADYARRNPTYHCRYYSWTETPTIVDFLVALPSGAHLTIVGHSYGGDTAFWVIGMSRHANVLISIDPVGRLRKSWAGIRSNADIWLNVRAEPSKDRRTSDDSIAGLGGKYPRPPNPGEASAPNYSLVVNTTHGRFRDMMHVSSRGISGESLLGGNHAP